MKVLVAVKRVVDPYVNIRIQADGSGVETANVKMSIDPFDAIAVEEAVRLREQGIAGEIIVVSIGVTACQDIIRAALASGADRGIFIPCSDRLSPLNIAKLLQTCVCKESIDLVIMGKQSIDEDNNQTGQILAGLLAWPQGTFASKLQVLDNKVEVTREVDGGLEILLLNLPAVITTDLRLNEPRYASLPNIMKARQKTITTITIEELGVMLKSHVQTLKVEPPETRAPGVIVDSVSELVKLLHEQERLI